MFPQIVEQFRTNEVQTKYNGMQEKGYPLDYLNVEYNIEEYK